MMASARAAITILVNGQRVPGLGDIDTFPAEAVERLDLLPRESGARVGAPAGRCVYNIVLKPQHRHGPRPRTRRDRGGAGGVTLDLGATRIKRPQRLNLTLERRHDSALFESERDIDQAPGAPAQLARARTLRPATRGADVTLSAADRLLPGVDGLVTLRLGTARSRSSLGLGGLDSVIVRVTRGRTVDLPTQLNAERGSWLVTLNGGARARRVLTSTDDGAGAQRVRSVTRSHFVDVLAHGPLARLPAGSLHVTLGASLRRDRGAASEPSISSTASRSRWAGRCARATSSTSP